MYGLPDGEEWILLVGKELLQVCIGSHQISLRFSGDISVNIECDFDHLPSAANGRRQLGLAVQAKSLVSLLGTQIVKAVSENDKTLLLSFTNDEYLKIYDSNATYESFHVLAPDKEIIV